MKIPKQLDISRSCFFQLPAGMSTPELIDHEQHYRKEYGELLVGRIDDRLYFMLPTPALRDAFLTSLEMSNWQYGWPVEYRVMYKNDGTNTYYQRAEPNPLHLHRKPNFGAILSAAPKRRPRLGANTSSN